jgi:hypothetical protein
MAGFVGSTPWLIAAGSAALLAGVAMNAAQAVTIATGGPHSTAGDGIPG